RVSVVVEAFDETVNPPEAERLADHVFVGDGLLRCVGLEEHEPDTRARGVMPGQPRPPLPATRDSQGRQFCRHNDFVPRDSTRFQPCPGGCRPTGAPLTGISRNAHFSVKTRRALRRHPWGIMRILRAAHLGMCFGVRDAIALALEPADAGPLTILGDLVHNPSVLESLEAKGIAVAQDVAAVKTPTVMVTAHGASERSLARSRALGLTVGEAQCPLVRVAHRAVAALV